MVVVPMLRTERITKYFIFKINDLILAYDKLEYVLKVGPDDATLFIGTRESVPMEHCSRVLQVLPSVSDSSEVSQLSQS